MAFEIFDKMEEKVQQAINTIAFLKVEIKELKEKNNSLNKEIQQTQNNCKSLVNENTQLKQEQETWQERLRELLSKMDEV
ncbi:MAG: cell division factor ZapB [Sodalis sp. Ffu]|nr:MAG: cell division factor ZapB [Sodalis sp. Ffu]